MGVCECQSIVHSPTFILDIHEWTWANLDQINAQIWDIKKIKATLNKLGNM